MALNQIRLLNARGSLQKNHDRQRSGPCGIRRCIYEMVLWVRPGQFTGLFLKWLHPVVVARVVLFGCIQVRNVEGSLSYAWFSNNGTALNVSKRNAERYLADQRTAAIVVFCEC